MRKLGSLPVLAGTPLHPSIVIRSTAERPGTPLDGAVPRRAVPPLTSPTSSLSREIERR